MRNRAGLVGGLWLLSGALGLLAGGCTSEPAGPVGSKLVENPLSDALDTLTITDLAGYSAFGIDGKSVSKMEVLYLGHQDTDGDSTSSAVLANYDFGNVYDETFTPEVLVASNINSVKMRLYMLKFYATLQEEGKFGADKILAKYFELRQLEEPFVPEDYPGPPPPSDDIYPWTQPSLHDEDDTVFIPIHPAALETWLTAGDTLGLMVKEWGFLPSTPGLVGLSSRDMKHAASQIDSFHADVSLGPTIVVDLIDPDETLYIEPIADTSTFQNIARPPADPADGLMMRTCLRNYPTLRFDLSALPPDVFINRATLTVVNDTLTSYGNLEAIVIAEFTDDSYLAPVDTFSLAGLESRVHVAAGMTSLDPHYHSTMTFNVTTALQRFVNQVYEGERALVLCAGEDFFPEYDLTSTDPDFYLARFNFFGTAADEALRPRLKITYSSIEDLQEVEP